MLRFFLMLLMIVCVALAVPFMAAAVFNIRFIAGAGPFEYFKAASWFTVLALICAWFLRKSKVPGHEILGEATQALDPETGRRPV